MRKLENRKSVAKTCLCDENVMKCYVFLGNENGMGMKRTITQ